jgi:hypothetical protein
MPLLRVDNVLQAVATEERAQRISRARTLRSEEYRLARAAASRVDELAADATVNAEGVRIAVTLRNPE